MAATEIVIADDEADLRELVSDYLEAHGYSTRVARDGRALDMALAARRADIVILDVAMPGEGGLEIARRLRASDPRLGILILTGDITLANRISGLRDGADDYVTKPFEPRELLARIRSLERRLACAPPLPNGDAPQISRGRLRAGPLDFDTTARRVIGATGTPIDLTAMEYDLLEVLARHAGQPLSRARLSELAHGRPLGDGDRSIDLRITRLRQKVENDPSAPALIRTVRGEGYMLDPG
ncbi:response regulator [Arenibaculum pallidiluteum]|uniref:response regulator n=1 Tax=Arenibaculum pallidiluteum TaxID=2812559 RepID=UPI001A962A98|nr:response regulator transcription factor [Arenibaculum pallidiluteum]